jgi:hypothetical protein
MREIEEGPHRLAQPELLCLRHEPVAVVGRIRPCKDEEAGPIRGAERPPEGQQERGPVHLVFDPNGFRQIIVNREAIAKALLNEAYRRLAWARDETLKQLITEILSYPGVPSRWREPDLEAPHELILPMELKLDGQIARMFSTVTTVATPHDVTLQELHVEVFYPADAETEAVLQSYEARTGTKV